MLEFLGKSSSNFKAFVQTKCFPNLVKVSFIAVLRTIAVLFDMSFSVRIHSLHVCYWQNMCYFGSQILSNYNLFSIYG